MRRSIILHAPVPCCGIALSKPSSFPVGKVNFMQIDPMTFSEFLLANGDKNLSVYLETVDMIEPFPDAFFNPLYEKLKMYYVTGGMPEAVKMWTEARDVTAMQERLELLMLMSVILRNILISANFRRFQ